MHIYRTSIALKVDLFKRGLQPKTVHTCWTSIAGKVDLLASSWVNWHRMMGQSQFVITEPLAS